MKIIIVAFLSILTSCTSLTGAVTAIQLVSSAKHTDLPRPEYAYKAGDKIQIWTHHSPPRTCDVLKTDSNPYSPDPMLAKYEINCPGDLAPHTITTKDLNFNEQRKERYLKLVGGRIPAEEKIPEAKYKPGTEVTYHDFDNNKLIQCTVISGGQDTDGLGPNYIMYSLKCPDEEYPVNASLTEIKNGKKLKKTGLASKSDSMNATVKQAGQRRIEALKNIKAALKD